MAYGLTSVAAFALERYPFPVASLVRRARNAKSPKERHDTAFYAWEASIRLAVAAAPPANTAPLAMASLGHWVGALPSRDAPLDDDAVLDCHALLTEVGQGKASRPKSVTPKKLLDGVPAYRNHVLGHGSARSAEFYEDAAAKLLAGLEAAWARDVFLDPGSRLVWVESVELAPDGRRRARIHDLTGLASTVLGGPVRADEHVLPRRVYVEHERKMSSLHPWLLYQEAELRERMLFFNGRARSSQYLDYLSGESLKGKPLEAAFPGIEADVDALFAEKRPSQDGTPVAEASDPSQFGDYRILGELGQGGMGIVYLAKQESLGRFVALKMLPEGTAEDPTAVARFKREIRALSRCDHPNVVKILASGEAQGRHYYAMELIQGADLSQVARALGQSGDFEAALSTAAESVRKAKEKVFKDVPKVPARHVSLALGAKNRNQTLAALFRDAARGLQHLHDQGILHRDIKPANLMVTESDHRVVIMDLGLAAMGDASRSITRDKSTLLGTLRYIPPEQLQRSLLQLDARADVYSLGVTLYELLTDRPFFDGDSEVRLIEQVLRATPPNASKVKASVPRDLGMVVAKATEKDPALRYVSAEAFAQDLDNFVQGKPVVARPPTLGYLLQVAIRRHRALAAFILATLVVIVAGTTAFIVRLRIALAEAEHQAQVAREQRQRAEESRYAADMRLTQQAADEGDYGAARELLLRHVPSAGEADLRGFEWRYLMRLLAGESLATFRGHEGEIRAVAFSPDGTRLASAGTDATVWVHDVAARKTVKRLAIDGPGVMALAYSPDGKTLAVASGNWRTSSSPGKVWLFDAASLEAKGVLAGHARSVNGIAFSDDGRYLATGSEDNTAMVWEVARGEAQKPRVFQAHTSGVNAVAFVHGTSRLAVGSGDGHVQVWDVESGKSLADALVHVSGIMSLAMAPDGTRLALGTRDGPVLLWNVATQTLDATLATSQGAINGVAFSPDGKTLATAGSNCTVKLWSADSLRPIGMLKGHQDMVFAIAFSPRGDIIASGSTDATVKLWPSSGAPREGGIPFDGAVAGVAFSPDGKTLAVAEAASPSSANARAPVAVLYDVPSRTRRAELAGHTDYLLTVAFSPDGKKLATGGMDDTAIVWDAASGAKRAVLTGHQEPVTQVAFSPDGKVLATASRDHLVHLWDAETGAMRGTLSGHPEAVRAVAFSPDGQYIATAGSDRTVRLWAARTYETLATLTGYEGATNAVAFDPTSTWLATASNDRTVRLWNVGAKRFGPADATVLQGHNAAVNAVAFSPDGRTLASASQDSVLSLWNVRTLLEVASFAPHEGGVLAVAFAPDGDALATGSNDQTVRILRAASAAEAASPPRPPSGWSSP